MLNAGSGLQEMINAVSGLVPLDPSPTANPVSGRFCGVGKLPGMLVSSESRMWIEYRTSGSGTHRGFLAKYEGM